MKQVVLVWGGWSCTLGYIRYAYVAECIEGQPVNTIIPGSEKIGTKLYDAPFRKEVSDPKNCDFGKKPNPFPLGVCRRWMEENECELMDTIKMRTD